MDSLDLALSLIIGLVCCNIGILLVIAYKLRDKERPERHREERRKAIPSSEKHEDFKL